MNKNNENMIKKNLQCTNKPQKSLVSIYNVTIVLVTHFLYWLGIN